MSGYWRLEFGLLLDRIRRRGLIRMLPEITGLVVFFGFFAFVIVSLVPSLLGFLLIVLVFVIGFLALWGVYALLHRLFEGIWPKMQ